MKTLIEKSDRRETKVKIRKFNILSQFLITTNKVFIFINILLINMDKQIFCLSFEIFCFVYLSLLFKLTISNHLFHKFFTPVEYHGLLGLLFYFHIIHFI